MKRNKQKYVEMDVKSKCSACVLFPTWGINAQIFTSDLKLQLRFPVVQMRGLPHDHNNPPLLQWDTYQNTSCYIHQTEHPTTAILKCCHNLFQISRHEWTCLFEHHLSHKLVAYKLCIIYWRVKGCCSLTDTVVLLLALLACSVTWWKDQFYLKTFVRMSLPGKFEVARAWQTTGRNPGIRVQVW